ncbi:hypothetical protein B0H16DRAFT_1693067 [Mycena metata]|uniref:Uncharacterized protein n=1 Tax=Mycena metata TaxID=1033252 RepID=A0AAD7IKE6_9AGAR|nr:hypothetical protein B0H16DRAFT_1693067 [Mycena metata]
MSAPARGRLNIESHSHWTLAQSKLPRGHGISQRVSDSTLPRRPTVISTSFGSAGALGIRPQSLRCNDFVVARATSSRLGVQCMRAGMPGTRPSAALAEPHTRISRSPASASATESLALARSRFGARPLHLNIRDLLTACGHRRAVCAIPPLANRRNMLLHFDVVKGGNNKTAHHLLTRMRTCADHALGARHRRCCKLKLKFYQLALPLCHTRGTRGPVSHFDELRTSAPRMIDWDARSYGTVERSCWYWPHPARSRLGCTQQPAGLDIVIAMVVYHPPRAIDRSVEGAVVGISLGLEEVLLDLGIILQDVRVAMSLSLGCQLPLTQRREREHMESLGRVLLLHLPPWDLICIVRAEVSPEEASTRLASPLVKTSCSYRLRTNYHSQEGRPLRVRMGGYILQRQSPVVSRLRVAVYERSNKKILEKAAPSYNKPSIEKGVKDDGGKKKMIFEGPGTRYPRVPECRNAVPNSRTVLKLTFAEDLQESLHRSGSRVGPWKLDTEMGNIGYDVGRFLEKFVCCDIGQGGLGGDGLRESTS